MAKWYKAERSQKLGGGHYPGVRYREHKTRKMDAVNLDRYYSIYYWWESKTVSEGIGWASEGHGAEEAAEALAELKRNQKNGVGPCTLAAVRESAAAERVSEEKERREQARLDISFQDFFEQHYLPEIRHANKPETIQKTISHVTHWIGPVVGDLSFREITLSHCKKIKRNLMDVGRAARTIQYVFTSFEAIWRFAQDDGLVLSHAPSKVRSFKKSLPKLDNRKERFLTFDEENRLLSYLGEKSSTTYDMVVVSLDTGLRWSEITALTWDRVDLESGVFHLTHTKSGESRWVPFTERVRLLLQEIGQGTSGEYVFQNRWGKRIDKLSLSFSRAVKAVGLNNGVTDPKMKISFHSLRHTFASRVLKAGASIYEVSKLLGHGSVKVTERYSHVVQEDLQSAIRKLELLHVEQRTKGKVVAMKTLGGS